jgi:hypothetical protein
LKALKSLDPEVEAPVAAGIALLKLKGSENKDNECHHSGGIHEIPE